MGDNEKQVRLAARVAARALAGLSPHLQEQYGLSQSEAREVLVQSSRALPKPQQTAEQRQYESRLRAKAARMGLHLKKKRPIHFPPSPGGWEVSVAPRVLRRGLSTDEVEAFLVTSDEVESYMSEIERFLSEYR